QIPGLMQAGKKYGMQTLNDALYQLHLAREVERDECLRVSPNPNEFLRMIGESPLTDDATDLLGGGTRDRKVAAIGGKR
ncbi:MAG TPA: type IV pili twitching motility protein PilT, partial [Gemmatimonadaceae bacterium]